MGERRGNRNKSALIRPLAQMGGKRNDESNNEIIFCSEVT